MRRILLAPAKLARKAQFLRDATASEIAEAALVFPLAFMLLLGIYWFGRAFNIYATLNHAAREGARAAVAQTCATCGNVAPLATSIGTVVSQALQASSIDPGQAQAYNPQGNFCAGSQQSQCTAVPVVGSSSSGQITVCTDVQLTPVASPYPPVCGVSVSFQYPYQLSLPFTSLNQQQFLLKANVQMKGEY
jgi:Flp pilus assembly protein TadG